MRTKPQMSESSAYFARYSDIAHQFRY